MLCKNILHLFGKEFSAIDTLVNILMRTGRSGTLVRMTKKKLDFYKHGFLEDAIILYNFCCCFSGGKKC